VIRPLALVTAAVALLGPFAAEALGAMYLRMSISPASPLVEETSRLAIQTGFLSHSPGSACVGDPGASFSPMRAEEWGTTSGKGLKQGDLAAAAEGPNGQRIEIPLSIRSEDTSFWDGEVTFIAPGEWIVRMTRPEWSGGEECGGARLRVTVRGPTESQIDATARDEDVASGGELLVLMLVVCAALLLAVPVWTQRRSQA
jgi:hypothetical protein